MQSLFLPGAHIVFSDHPRFAGVKFAPLVSRADSAHVSVSLLDISPGTEIPVHTHDTQVDSIFVVKGKGEAWVNGQWTPIAPGDYILAPETLEHGIRNSGPEDLSLFVHHSPPLF